MKFDEPDEVASAVLRLMDGFGAPWCVAGGWALDLFLGRATRPHADLELAVFRQDQSRLRAHFEGWKFMVSVDGRREPLQQGETLELPLHEIHAYSPGEPQLSIEFLLNERDAASWIFRRNPEVVLPLDRAMINSEFGVAALSPEIVLLFKAKAPREKDQADFQAASSAMSNSSGLWLRSALMTCHPGHPWIPLLDRGRSPCVGP